MPVAVSPYRDQFRGKCFSNIVKCCMSSSFVHDPPTNIINEETFLQDASELLENLEEIFPRHYVDSDCINPQSYADVLPSRH